MDRNLILAFILSSVIMIGYYSIFPPQEVENVNQVVQKNSPKESSIKREDMISNMTNLDSKLIVVKGRSSREVNTSVFKIKLDSALASISSIQLLKYNYAIEQHMNVKDWFFAFFTGDDPTPPEVDLNRKVEMVAEKTSFKPFSFFVNSEKKVLNYQIVSTSSPFEVKMRANVDGISISKRYKFDRDSYISILEIDIFNDSNEDKVIEPVLFVGSGHEDITVGEKDRHKVGVYYTDNDLEKIEDEDDIEESSEIKDVKWAGLMDRHFLTAVEAGSAFRISFDKKRTFFFDEQVVLPSLSFKQPITKLKSKETKSYKFKIYTGPKRSEELEKFDPTLTTALDFGFLETLANILLAILKWIQSYVGNWGVAVILLTIIVRIVLFPLALKGMLSMGKMSKLTPKMQQLKIKYKNDKERLNREIMELYKKQKVNPVGGCLPMVMQIPIFFALYSALLPAIELRHQPFYFWIKDLSAPDYTLILPILMGVSMFLQQKLTPMAATMDPSQEKMMKFLPIFMTFFLLKLPAGLVLYWVVSNVISIFQQMLFNRLKKKQNIT